MWKHRFLCRKYGINIAETVVIFKHHTVETTFFVAVQSVFNTCW